MVSLSQGDPPGARLRRRDPAGRRRATSRGFAEGVAHRGVASRPSAGSASLGGAAPGRRVRNLPAMLSAVLVATGLFLAIYGSLRGYVAARSALMPLVREGDPTRTLGRLDPSAPCADPGAHWPCATSRVRADVAGARDVRPVPRDCRRRAAPMTAAADPKHRRRHGAVRGRHRHRGPLPASDGVEDVLRLFDCLLGYGSEHPCVPGLPRPSRGAPGDQPPGGRARDRDRDAIEAEIPGALPVGAQELLLPGPAQGLPDQPVCDPARGTGPAHRRDLGRAFTVPITRAHLEEDTAKLIHGEVAGEPGTRGSLLDYNRSGAPLMEMSPSRAPDRGAGPPGAEERHSCFGPSVRDADMERGQMRVEANISLRPRDTRRWDPGRGQEHELVPRGRARDRVRDRPAGPGAGQRRAAGHGDPRLGRRPAVDLPDGSKETSEDYRYFPEPDLPPLHVDPAWTGGSGRRCRSCPAARRARYEARGFRPTMPRCSWRTRP